MSDIPIYSSAAAFYNVVDAKIRKIGWHAYHGTTNVELDSFLEVGVVPKIGSFVEEAYGEVLDSYFDYFAVETLPQLEDHVWDSIVSYYASGDEIDRALNAISAQVAKLHGRGAIGAEVTLDEIKKFGALLCFEDAGDLTLFDESNDYYALRPFKDVDVDDIWEEMAEWKESQGITVDDEWEPTENEIDEFLKRTKVVVSNAYVSEPDEWLEEIPPIGVEPGDLFAAHAKKPDAVVLGEALVLVFEKYQ